MHEYSLLTIVGWLLHALTQWAREIAPLVHPTSESRYPESWWNRYYSIHDWWFNLDSEKRPNATLCDLWVKGCFRLLGDWVGEVGEWAIDQAVREIRTYTGLPAYGYSTFNAWLRALRHRVGTSLPHFASDLASGLYTLYFKLPSQIRTGAQSWSDLWGDIAQMAYERVRPYLQIISTKADILATWVNTQGSELLRWYEEVRSTVHLLRNHPTSFITSKLQPHWGILVSFATDAAKWYYNLKALWGKELVAFLSEPGKYILDKVIKRIEEQW